MELQPLTRSWRRRRRAAVRPSAPGDSEEADSGARLAGPGRRSGAGGAGLQQSAGLRAARDPRLPDGGPGVMRPIEQVRDRLPGFYGRGQRPGQGSSASWRVCLGKLEGPLRLFCQLRHFSQGPEPRMTSAPSDFQSCRAQSQCTAHHCTDPGILRVQLAARGFPGQVGPGKSRARAVAPTQANALLARCRPVLVH